ncbi:272_t:CDS:2, partial [Cetraspora pellucida]
TVERHWPGTDFFKMVRLVVTTPAEFTENTKIIMRQCIYDANLINNNDTLNLQFATELVQLILTVRKLLNSNQLSKTTERSGGFFGSTYVNKNFVKYLENKVGKYQISNLQEKDYHQYHYMIQKFCENESKYLQSKIKQTFGNIYKIATSPNPVATVVCGAVQYGLDMNNIKTRVLKWTYGIKFIQNFKRVLTRHHKCEHEIILFTKLSIGYCDEPEVKVLAEFDIELPNIHLGIDRLVSVNLCFGKMEMMVTVKNVSNRDI